MKLPANGSWSFFTIALWSVCLGEARGAQDKASTTMPTFMSSEPWSFATFDDTRNAIPKQLAELDDVLDIFSYSFSEYPGCLDAGGYPPFIADGDCDRFVNNVEECDYDGGDCCSCTCEDGEVFKCDPTEYHCLDPTVSEECVEESRVDTTSSGYYYELYQQYPDCEDAGGYVAGIGNGACDFASTIEECGYDGGDCCSCTCLENGHSDCGERGGYYCLDPGVSAECAEESASYIPFTSSTTGYLYSQYPGCYEINGHPIGIGDGFCNLANNEELCGYDGGDCCSCTCVSTLVNKCGPDSAFYCRDPNVSDECVEESIRIASELSETENYLFSEYPGCFEANGYAPYIGNGRCDFTNSNEECAYDGGDCCSCSCVSSEYTCGMDNGYYCLDPTVSSQCVEDSASYNLTEGSRNGGYSFGQYPGCYEAGGYPPYIGDGSCNVDNNNEECAFDGGDCCSCTCVDLFPLYPSCGEHIGFFCEDPSVSETCKEESDSHVPSRFSPDIELVFKQYRYCLVVAGNLDRIGNGDCNFENSNEECGYDGGDCCTCTCVDTADFTCGENGGYYCRDPSVSAACMEESNSYIPIISSTTGYRFSQYPGCFEVDGDATTIGDGLCEVRNNNEECGYDGGDCCPCTCVDAEFVTCGEDGYDCQDPSVPADCD